MTAFSPDPWLSETLERPVYKLNGPPGDDIAALMSQLAGGRDAFFFARIPTTDVRTCSLLTAAGFRVVDTTVTFAWAGNRPISASPNVTVGPARPEQFAVLQDIAGSCFRWSRFHLDPMIPTELADRVKKRWIENYCLGKRGSALYAAEVDGKTVGFLAVVESSGAAFIDLVGVAPEAQGMGVGVALTRHFIESWKDRAGELKVGTQVANIRSMRLYERAGFSVVDSSYVLHAHHRS